MHDLRLNYLNMWEMSMAIILVPHTAPISDYPISPFKLCSMDYQAVTSGQPVYSKHASAIAKGTDTSFQ